MLRKDDYLYALTPAPQHPKKQGNRTIWGRRKAAVFKYIKRAENASPKHKREFEKHFDRLNSTCSYLDTRVTNAIPAMKYDLDTRLKGKADQRDLDHIEKDKASNAFVEQVVKRLNKLEEKVNRRRGGASSSSGSDGSRSRRSGSISHISEEDEDASDDSGRRKRRSRKDKILKGSSSMDMKDKKPQLDQIEEEKEASIKSSPS